MIITHTSEVSHTLPTLLRDMTDYHDDIPFKVQWEGNSSVDHLHTYKKVGNELWATYSDGEFKKQNSNWFNSNSCQAFEDLVIAL
jgi:hypothetical protein